MKAYQCISIEQAEPLFVSGRTLILDMRDYRSYLTGHHPKALHLSDANLRSLLKHTAKQVPILIYCYHGHSSQDMAQLFADFGFREVYSLDGGWEALFQVMTPPREPLTEDLLQWLQTRGFDPENLDSRIANQHTPLMQGAIEANHSVCSELLDKGATPDLVNKDGNNALWFACHSQHPELVRQFVSQGVNIDNQNDNGATALMYAASSGKAAIVRLLLELGARTDLVTLDEFSALDMCADLESLRLLRNATKGVSKPVIAMG